MKYIKNLLNLVLISISFNLLLFGNCIANKIKLFYEIYYGPFKVGESEIQITPSKYTAIVYSVGLAKSIFPFYAKWETWIDNNGYPQKAIIYSNEKGKERKRLIYFKKEENKIVYQKLLPNCEEPENIFLEFPIYDELSSFIASFYINYNIYPRIRLPLFIKKKREYVRIEFKEIKNCELGKEKKECLYIEVYLPKKSELLERASEVEILLLKDKKVPLELRGKLPIFGSLVGKLRKVETF